MIRGAIALGLAIKAGHYFSEYDFVVASVLALVIVSTLLFGSFMPLVAKCCLDPPKKGDSKPPELTMTTFSQGAQSPMQTRLLDSPEKLPGFGGSDREFHSHENPTAADHEDLRSGPDQDGLVYESKRLTTRAMPKGKVMVP